MFTSPRPQKAPAGAGGKPAGDGGAAGARPDGPSEVGHRRQPSRTSEGSSLASDVEPVASIPAMNAARASVGSLPELAHQLNGAESEESDDDGDAGEEIASLLHQGEQSEQMRLFDLAVRMSGEVDVRDHKRNLKKHKACFTGRVAVQWMLTNGVARTVDDAVATGQKLSDAGLVVPVAAGRAFLNRSFLYRFGDGMDRYVQAARWCLSQEMGKIRGEVKDVCAVVDRHTAATRAISAEHASAMERVELVMFEMRTQLAWTRAAVFMLAASVLFLTFASHASEDDVRGGLSEQKTGLFGESFSAAARFGSILPRFNTHALVVIVASALSFSAGVFVVDRKSFDAVLHTADHRYFLDGIGGDDEPDSDDDDDDDDESIDGDGNRSGGSIGRPDLAFLAGPGSSRGVAGLRRRLRRRGSAQNLRIDVDASDAGGTPTAGVAGVADKYTPRGPGLRSLSQRSGFRDVDSPRGNAGGRVPGTPTRRLARLTSFGRFFGMSPRSRGAGGGSGLGSSRGWEEGLDGASIPSRPEDQALPPPLASSAVFGDVGSKPVGLRLSPEYPRQWIPRGPARPRDGVSLPAQVPFEFETELFKGKAVIYLRGLGNTPERVFKGKARAIQFSVQGVFKREVAMDDLHFGLSLARPLRNLPTRWLLNLCTRVVQSLGAQYSMDLSDPTADRPYMLAPIVLAAQTVSCAARGSEPDIALPPIEDNARLTWLGHGGKGVGANERRRKIAKIIRDAKHARKKAGVPAGTSQGAESMRDGRVPSFDVDSVWTFSFWQSQIDVSKYSVDLGVGKFDLVPIMDGQPIALLCQTSDASCVGFRFEVWHERLLQKAHSRQAPDEIAERPSRDSTNSTAGDGSWTSSTAGRGEAPEEAPEEAAARPIL